ncbi:MFS transporter [Actinacidiphila acididurans]|uniref:MFS transporter n=1 Tax=Actinacidiphila acididurans TaxID=2784346 RepID=A0ABS2TZZ2_9ACTN|nr:MFS transporter [Actinacidiphila acididurans]MBM9508896.1 MFS transporter [Actinacidiphila acididurans]
MTTATLSARHQEPKLRHNRRFRMLWAGQVLSGFGSSMSGVALPLVLLAAGRPTTAVAVVGTAVALAGLTLRIPAGLISDRYDQRVLLIGCDLLRLVAIGTVAVWVAVRPLPLWLALGAVVVSAAATEVFKPSQFRLIRRIVTPGQIPSAISLNQARAYAADMAGPAAAGLLIGTRPAVPFAVDALSFLASAVCVAATVRGLRPAPAVPEDAPAARHAQGPGFWSRLTVGLRHVARDPFLRRSTVFFSGLTVTFTMLGSTLLLGVGRESGGARAVGWALSTAALAGLLGSLSAPYLRRLLPLPVLVATGPAVATALLVTAWLTGSTLALVAGFSAMCLLVPAINAAVVAVMATSIPEEIYGRVGTANDFVVQLLQPCAPLAAGLLLVRGSLATTALVLAACFAVLAVLALTLPAPEPAPTGRPETPPE